MDRGKVEFGCELEPCYLGLYGVQTVRKMLLELGFERKRSAQAILEMLSRAIESLETRSILQLFDRHALCGACSERDKPSLAQVLRNQSAGQSHSL